MSNQRERILAINPGSTSVKIGVFDGEQGILNGTVQFEINQEDGIESQQALRLKQIEQYLENAGIAPDTICAVAGRGGKLKPIPSGVFAINDAMYFDTIQLGTLHSSLWGLLLARAFGKAYGIPSFVVDPPLVDEYWPVAKISGLPLFERESAFHALNQKATARRYAQKIGKEYEQLCLIVAHLGGGMSINLHYYGKVVDGTHSMYGGPFTPERAGRLRTDSVVELCFSGKYTKKEVLTLLTKGSGLYAYLGTKDVAECVMRAEGGDRQAVDVLDAMIYQINKAIGEMYAAAECKVDAILLTGGIAHSDYITSRITRCVSLMASVCLFPGENELVALSQGALSALRGTVPVLEYPYSAK